MDGLGSLVEDPENRFDTLPTNPVKTPETVQGLSELNRDGGIRTHGPFVPNEVRYQTALHSTYRRKTTCIQHQHLRNIAVVTLVPLPVNTHLAVKTSIILPPKTIST
jgi:hypothetical protein